MLVVVLLALLVAVQASPAAVVSTADRRCDVRGYDLAVKAYSYSRKASLASAEACGAKCRTSSKCRSYAFSSSECLLYSKEV